MRAFTIHLSADATVMLDEMRIYHGAKPEDVIHVIVEGSLADALRDEDLFETFLEQADRAGANARGYWKDARFLERFREMNVKRSEPRSKSPSRLGKEVGGVAKKADKTRR